MANEIQKNGPKYSVSLDVTKFMECILGQKITAHNSIGTETSIESLDKETMTDVSLSIPAVHNDPTIRMLPDWMKNINNQSECNSSMLVRSAATKRSADEDNQSNKKARLDLPPAQFVFNKNAIKNLTDLEIPDDMLLLLSFGPKFIPPVLKFDKAQVLSDISKLKNNVQGQTYITNSALTKTLKLVENYKNMEPTWRQTQINNLVSLTNAFIKEHPEIMIDTSDKGNVTVIINKKDYDNKIIAKLSNNDAYQAVLISEHEQIMKENYTLLLRCAEQGMVPHGSVIDIVAMETQYSQVYGQIKIHKEDHPVRLINANVNVVGCKIASIILPVLNSMVQNDPFTVSNSVQLSNKLKLLNLKDDDRLFSLDIVDMFTNIPVDMAWNIIKDKGINNYTRMPPGLFEDIFKFITTRATEFKFKNNIFKMVKGLPMGVATSPSIACLVTTKLLLDSLPLVGPITYICKYVDDILLITNKQNADNLLKVLNSHPTLKFKLEEEETHGELNYLDLTLIRRGKKITTKWYYKPYASNRLINWFSAHDKKITTNTAINFIRNMFNLTTDNLYKEEIEYLAFKILHNNSFPKKVIEQIINSVKNNQFPANRDLPKFVGTKAPLQLMGSLNVQLKNNVHGYDVQFVNKSFSQNLANKVFSSRKEEEQLENRNFMILELTCKDCSFRCISPVIYPIKLFKVFGLQPEKHPFYDMQMHVNKNKHSGFNHKVIRTCEDKAETLRLAEIEASIKKVQVHAAARKSNVEIVRKMLNNNK